MIIETDLDGRYLTIDGPAWYPDAIGKTGFDYGTPEANELLRAAMEQLKSGKHVVITGFHTIDGRTCKSIMRRVGDKILIRSTDTTPVEDAIGDE